MVQLNVKVPPEVRDALHRLARADDRTLDAFVRRHLTALADSAPAPSPPEAPQSRSHGSPSPVAPDVGGESSENLSKTEQRVVEGIAAEQGMTFIEALAEFQKIHNR